jgi:ribonuclease Z
MNFTLTVLGSASAKPVPGRFQSAQVLCVHGRFFLIDCGEGVQTRLQEAGISSMKIDAIFISHIHGDHLFGIFGLLSTLGMLGRTAPLNIYGPSNLGPILNFYKSYFWDESFFEIRFNPLGMKEPQVIYSTKSMEILAFPLNHKIETYGYIFREKEPLMNVRKEKIQEYGLSLTEIGAVKRGEDVVREYADGRKEVLPFAELGYKPFEPRSYAYCSDTAPFKNEAEWVKGVDLLYHEATYTNEYADQAAKRYHSTAMQAAQCALQAGVGKLVIGHYSSRIRDISLFQNECRSIFPESYAANDLDVYDIPIKKI